ncbi:MAG: DUF4476 domain-containing protein [Flavobacteriales bacterium]
MKNCLLLLTFSFILFQAKAQSGNAVVFSENGEAFSLILNGVKVNESPASNVKAVSLTNEFYQARIDFQDAALPDFSQNNFAVHLGQEVTYMIKKNKKGEYVLRWQGEAPMSVLVQENPKDGPSEDVRRVANADDQPADSQTMQVNTNMNGTGGVQMGVNVGVSGNATTNSSNPTNQNSTGVHMGVNGGSSEDNVQMNVNFQVTEQDGAANGTTNQANNSTGGNVSMNMQVDGVNGGVNFQVNEAQENSTVNTNMGVTNTTVQVNNQTSSSTTTTTTITSNSRPQETVHTGRCSSSMDATSFNSAKGSINSKSFEDSKLTLAKQVAKSNCMTAAQVKDVMGLFAFEETKLEFAKYAYDYCYNQGNYYEVNDAFDFESTIEDLNKYLESK